mgnify:CR=1 FL=1
MCLCPMRRSSVRACVPHPCHCAALWLSQGGGYSESFRRGYTWLLMCLEATNRALDPVLQSMRRLRNLQGVATGLGKNAVVVVEVVGGGLHGVASGTCEKCSYMCAAPVLFSDVAEKLRVLLSRCDEKAAMVVRKNAMLSSSVRLVVSCDHHCLLGPLDTHTFRAPHSFVAVSCSCHFAAD